MYGQLLFNPDNAEAPWTVTFFLCVDLAPPELSKAQTGEREAALTQLKSEASSLSPAEAGDLSLVAKGLPEGRMDMTSDLFLALTHIRLPVALRKEREARIDRAVASYFVGMSLPPQVTTGIQYIKLIARLTPDAFLEGMVCSQAARLQMVLTTLPAWAIHCVGDMHHLEALTTALGIVSRSAEDRLAFSTLYTRPWAQRSDFLALMENAVQFKLLDAVRKTEVALRDAGLLVVFEGDMLVKVLQDCQAAGLNGSMEADIDTVVANQMALFRAAELARHHAVLETTIEATRAGAPLGSRVTAQNLAAITAANQTLWQQILRMTPERLRLQRKLDTASSSRPSAAAAEPVDLDPVHAWSVSRLLRWIEGPIMDAAPAPLERAKFVVREKTARQEARAKTKMPETAVRADQDLTDLDIDFAVQNALSTTAEFFIGDIEDMLFRAATLGDSSPATQACADLLEPLRQLKSADRPDDQKARALLHRASLAVDLLRRDIRTRAFDVRTRQRFAQQLQAAVYNEPMAEGKRHGGVINCPLKRSDWPWVAEQYHRRWLPWGKQIVIDGVPRALQADQALGLYVTGKSLSGYEFDVSVHLWLRKPGRHSAPGTSLSPFAPMNSGDWIDTLTPCAVLHVKSAG